LILRKVGGRKKGGGTCSQKSKSSKARRNTLPVNLGGEEGGNTECKEGGGGKQLPSVHSHMRGGEQKCARPSYVVGTAWSPKTKTYQGQTGKRRGGGQGQEEYPRVLKGPNHPNLLDNKGKRTLPLVTAGNRLIGVGTLATSNEGRNRVGGGGVFHDRECASGKGQGER